MARAMPPNGEDKFVENAIQKVIVDRFHQLLEECAEQKHAKEWAICEAQREFIATLTPDQINMFFHIDSLIISAETDKMEKMFRLGFIDGLKTGEAILS
jgi:hypothetical protein